MRVHEDVRRMTQGPGGQCFEGAKFDLSKPLNPWFVRALSHPDGRMTVTALWSSLWS